MPTILTIKIPVDPGRKAQPVLFTGAVNSLNETSSLLPDGVYTTFRTYQKKYVLYLTEHFERLIHSAQLTGHRLRLDTDRIRLELRKALAQFSAEETRVRISIDLTKDIGNIYLILEELHIPALQEYRCGVAVITRKMHRENPQAKVTSFISRADQVRREEGMAAINETLMVSDQDQILEGLSSNFFGIRNRVIYTAGEGVLPGITRKLVIEVAEEAGFPVELRGIKTDELGQLSEAFITSASRAILPVTKINNRPVGTGQVGKITQTLQIAFQKNLDAALEEI